MALSEEDLTKVRSMYNSLSKEDQDFIQNNLNPDKRIKFAAILNEKTKPDSGLDLLLNRAGLTPQKLKENLDNFEVSRQQQLNVPIQTQEQTRPGTALGSLSAAFAMPQQIGQLGSQTVQNIDKAALGAVDRNPDSLATKAAAIAIPTAAKFLIPKNSLEVLTSIAGLGLGISGGKISEKLAETAAKREGVRNLPELLLDAYQKTRKTLGDNIGNLRESILRDPSADEKIFDVSPIVDKAMDAANFKEVGKESNRLINLIRDFTQTPQANEIRKELSNAIKNNSLTEIKDLNDKLSTAVSEATKKTPREILEFLDKADTGRESGNIFKNIIQPTREMLGKVYPEYVDSISDMRGLFKTLEESGLERSVSTIKGTQRLVTLAKNGKILPRELDGLQTLEQTATKLNNPVSLTDSLEKAKNLSLIRRYLPANSSLNMLLDLPSDLIETISRGLSTKITPESSALIPLAGKTPGAINQ